MSATSPRIALIGLGRMGRELRQLAGERGWPVVAEIGSANNRDSAAITPRQLADADVAIEFTVPRAAAANARACLRAGVPVVVGTTGWSDQLPAVAAEAQASGGALLTAANFSVGVNVLWAVAAQAARLMRRSGGFAPHIVETHHAAKRDAPSGTAIELQRVAGEAFGADIPVTSVRVGSVPGTHELLFDGAFEQLRIEHVARDRRVFAAGALDAAQWLIGRRGVFTMRDVIGDIAGGDAG